MPKVTVEINDNLDELVSNALDEVMEELEQFLDLNEPDECPELHEFEDSLHEIVDGSVPCYTHDIKGLWYLYEYEFKEAYGNAGVGNDPTENDGMTAIYFYIEQEVRNQYEDRAQEVFDNWKDARRREKGFQVLSNAKDGDTIYINGKAYDLDAQPSQHVANINDWTVYYSGLDEVFNVNDDEIEEG